MFYLLDEHGLFDFKADKTPGGKGLSQIPGKLAKMVEIAAQKFDLRFKPRYLLCLQAQGRGAGLLEGTVKYRILAGLYDLEKDLIHSFEFIHDSMADDPKALRTSLGEAAQETVESLCEVAAQAP
jgi:hypothetical protein